MQPLITFNFMNFTNFQLSSLISYLKISLICLCISGAINVSAQEKVLLWGAGASYMIPDNGFLQFKTDQQNFHFATVANSGFGLNGEAMWFFNPQLSLGSELGYAYFPKDKLTWDMQQYGNIKVNYSIANLSVVSNIYFSEEEIRPYAGAVFGLYYLHNMLDFDSNYGGTDGDQSVNYTSDDFLPGFGFQGGVLTELGDDMFLSLSLRFTTIPNLHSTKYDGVTVSPHEQENHWSLSVKLLWGR